MTEIFYTWKELNLSTEDSDVRPFMEILNWVESRKGKMTNYASGYLIRLDPANHLIFKLTFFR